MKNDEQLPEPEGQPEPDDIDLILENQALELDIKLQGGGEMWKSEDVDPHVHNEFLRGVKEWDELDKGPKRSLKSLFPDGYTFPPADQLTDEQLADKLDEIAEILDQHEVHIGLVGDVPDRLVYKYLVEDAIPNTETFAEDNTGFNLILDGCDGYCPECFQKEYCDTAKEWDKPLPELSDGKTEPAESHDKPETAQEDDQDLPF
jgi:hypothetical protein